MRKVEVNYRPVVGAKKIFVSTTLVLKGQGITPLNINDNKQPKKHSYLLTDNAFERLRKEDYYFKLIKND